MTSSLAERILDAFPSGSYSLSAFLRLLDIVETDAVPTAAVECRIQPRLLINPSFVRQHAATPEKLLMLVMHELHHVLLGHTTLFARVTPVQNFVFDAVINGIVCRMFPRAEYLAFFRDYYSAESFPECLLAPPPGWPGAKLRTAPGVLALPNEWRGLVRQVHLALYSEAGATYQEVYELLPKLLGRLRTRSSSSAKGPRPDLDDLVKRVPLLGGHGQDEQLDSGLEVRSPVLFDIVRSVVEEWPQPPDPIRGRSLADVLEEGAVSARRVPSNRARLRKLIRKIAGVDGCSLLRRVREDRLEAPTPIPTLARRSLVLRALGHEPLLHPGAAAFKRRAPAGERVHVYLDVSASMDSVLGALYAAIVDCAGLVAPTVHLYSTKIADITLAQLRAGRRKTTGGTGIGCVAEHMASHRVTRALLVTDGWVGKPDGQHHATLAKARLAVAYLGDSLNQTDLQAVARHTCILSKGAPQ
jgi:hypothetical protein